MKYCESSGEDTSQTSVLQFMQEGFIVFQVALESTMSKSGPTFN